MARNDLKELCWGVVRKALRLCRVSLPARVTEYDRQLRRASVQPQVNIRMGDGQVEVRKPLADRPVWLPRGGGFAMWFDLEPGDPCITLIADESTAEFYTTGQAGAPVFDQQHDQSDAVILPGGTPDPEQKPITGPGQAGLGTPDLTACIIFSRATTESPGQAGKVEIRAAVRVDIAGVNGLPIARATDRVKPDANLIAIIGAAAVAANTLTPGSVSPAALAAFELGMGTIDDRPDPKGYSE